MPSHIAQASLQNRTQSDNGLIANTNPMRKQGSPSRGCLCFRGENTVPRDHGLPRQTFRLLQFFPQSPALLPRKGQLRRSRELFHTRSRLLAREPDLRDRRVAARGEK